MGGGVNGLSISVRKQMDTNRDQFWGVKSRGVELTKETGAM